MGLIKVVLNDESALSCAILNDLLTITRQVNTLPLWKTLWLDNIGFLFLYRFALFINKLFSEIWCLLRDEPSFGKELVLLRKGSLHFHQVSRQVIFPGDDIHPRKLVDLLIGLHLREEISCYPEVMPCYVPICWQLLIALLVDDGTLVVFLYFFGSVAENLLGNSLDNVIFSASHVHHVFPKFLLGDVWAVRLLSPIKNGLYALLGFRCYNLLLLLQKWRGLRWFLVVICLLFLFIAFLLCLVLTFIFPLSIITTFTTSFAVGSFSFALSLFIFVIVFIFWVIIWTVFPKRIINFLIGLFTLCINFLQFEHEPGLNNKFLGTIWVIVLITIKRLPSECISFRYTLVVRIVLRGWTFWLTMIFFAFWLSRLLLIFLLFLCGHCPFRLLIWFAWFCRRLAGLLWDSYFTLLWILYLSLSRFCRLFWGPISAATLTAHFLRMLILIINIHYFNLLLI